MASNSNDKSPEESAVLEEIGQVLQNLKTLEENATKYHALSEQLHALEQSCIKEISNQRRTVKELKSKASKIIPKIKEKSESDAVEISDYVFAINRKFRHVEYQFPRSAL
ncbi:hypothetical protein HK098_000619 [Nowakowskiella sp. JEL0407]|nr:hypothetical protein HK098_000619 [Nowakowskiella sp. JEL0407]